MQLDFREQSNVAHTSVRVVGTPSVPGLLYPVMLTEWVGEAQFHLLALYDGRGYDALGLECMLEPLSGC